MTLPPTTWVMSLRPRRGDTYEVALKDSGLQANVLAYLQTELASQPALALFTADLAVEGPDADV